MTELLSRILDALGNPVLIAVAANFVLTILLLWKFYEKQRELFLTQTEFIRDRIELYKQENEELRRQIQTFREENERLRKTSSLIVNAVDDLRAQPLLSQKQLDELQTISNAARIAVEQSLPATKEMLENSVHIIDAVHRIAQANEKTLQIQIAGFNNLERAVQERAGDQEIAAIVQELVHLVGESQRGLGARIRDLEERAGALSDARRKQVEG